ncbi:FKBP70, partial [Symbiodinium pilosum]
MVSATHPEPTPVLRKRCEITTLQFTKNFNCGSDSQELTGTLTLHQIYETKDISFKLDKTLFKKQVVEGEGYEVPKDGSRVQLRVEAAVDQAKTAIPSFQPQVLEFVAGDGEVADALELCVAEMKKGEK